MYTTLIPNNLPERFKKTAVSLSPLHNPSDAWPILDTIEILKWMSDATQLTVLGGDTYVLSGDKITPRTEGWYYNPNDPQKDHEQSIAKALEYLQGLDLDKFDGYIVDMVAV